MLSRTVDPVALTDSGAAEQRDSQVRRYASRVTIGVILLCNSVLVLGIWVSGLNLNRLVRTPDVFNLKEDVCVRYGWHRVAGVERPVRLCSEWINLSDPSGETHKFQRETVVLQGADGQLYLDHGPRVDYRLLLIVVAVLLVIGFGITLSRYLIARYRMRLETARGEPSSIIQ